MTCRGNNLRPHTRSNWGEKERVCHGNNFRLYIRSNWGGGVERTCRRNTTGHAPSRTTEKISTSR